MRWPTRSPWLALAALVVLFELPVLLLGEPWRPSAEPVVLAGAWLAGERVRFGAVLRVVVAVAGTVLVLFRIDRVAFLLLLGDEPLLYDQLFLLRHLFVLIGDLWSVRAALGLVALAAAIAGAVWLVRKLLALLALPDDAAERRRLYAGLALLLSCALIAGALGDPPGVRWATSQFLANVAESARIYRGVQRRLGASPYAGHAAIALKRKPDLHLVLVESYGRILVEHPALRARWLAQVERMEAVLASSGWHAVSGFSRAPVMGGRSWLAEASMLTGMRVSYQALFHHLTSQIDRVPHLVRFLRRQGYHTVVLGPADRERPGIKASNPYGYDQRIGFVDLDYRGPKLGWGLVPDQYSLEYTREHVLRRAPRPLFFNFHMVTSHAPWEPLPELVADWRSLNDRAGPAPDAKAGSPYTALKRFVRSTRAWSDMGELRDDLGDRYARAIAYDLAVLEQHLSAVPDDTLVVALGDHQPPFLASQMRSYDTPVHVFARDPLLLEEFRRHRFKDGLRLGAGDPTAITHEGLYSLLVRGLTRCCAQPAALPPYRDDIVLGN